MNRVLLKVDGEFLCYQLQFPEHLPLRRTLVQHIANHHHVGFGKVVTVLEL